MVEASVPKCLPLLETDIFRYLIDWLMYVTIFDLCFYNFFLIFQADYLGLPIDGPYKPDHYRY